MNLIEIKCMWNLKWLHQIRWVKTLCVCLHVPTYSQFLLFLIQTNPSKYDNFSVSFYSGVSFPPSLDCLFSPFFFPISPFLIFLESGAVAGSQRLQQIINATDPLEIQADVHWTHIREKEEEERMVPTSEPSTSRGNCFRIQERDSPRSIFCLYTLFPEDFSVRAKAISLIKCKSWQNISFSWC